MRVKTTLPLSSQHYSALAKALSIVDIEKLNTLLVEFWRNSYPNLFIVWRMNYPTFWQFSEIITYSDSEVVWKYLLDQTRWNKSFSIDGFTCSVEMDDSLKDGEIYYDQE